MARHKERCKLNYSCQKLYGVIADVERYPEFLPFWQAVHVSKVTHIDSEHLIYSTRQTIQFGPIIKNFYTETHLFPYKRIHIQSTDPLFQTFNMEWLLIAADDSGCTIDFNLNCVASSIFLRPAFDAVLLGASHSIVSAFENRAKLIYGDKATLVQK